MATPPSQPVIVRTRVSAWGFIVALGLGLAYVAAGAALIDKPLLPPRMAGLVEPPQWLPGAVLLGFALFLMLVGIAEFGRYVRPATEVVVTRDGLSTFGLLGERRVPWADVLWAEISDDLLSLKLRQKGRLPPPDARMHLSRLDIAPSDLIAAIRFHRPDLLQ